MNCGFSSLVSFHGSICIYVLLGTHTLTKRLTLLLKNLFTFFFVRYWSQYRSKDWLSRNKYVHYKHFLTEKGVYRHGLRKSTFIKIYLNIEYIFLSVDWLFYAILHCDGWLYSGFERRVLNVLGLMHFLWDCVMGDLMKVRGGRGRGGGLLFSVWFLFERLWLDLTSLEWFLSL